MEIVGTGVRKKISFGIFLSGFLVFAFFIGKPGFIGYSDGVNQMRDLALRGDLYAMRAVIDQYTLDRGKRPQSLTDLVNAGYLQRLPRDPLTGRNDTWVPEFSIDPKGPGIVDVRSGGIPPGNKAKMMANAAAGYLISFMPLMITLLGWIGTYRARRTRPLHPFAYTLLAIVTVVAAVPACSYVYFELHPVRLPPWKSPEIVLLSWLFFIGGICMLISLLAFRREPKWLFWVLESASLWLCGIGVLAVAAY